MLHRADRRLVRGDDRLVVGLLAVEFLNTAIEKLSDHVTPEHRNAIGRIKDYGSAGVFSAICLAGLTWLAALAIRCGLM